jgi:protein gp37
MADKTSIEWTRGADGSPGATWNPITGCSVVSPGCTNCYAMRLAGTRLHQHPSRAGLTKDSKAGPVWTGEVRFNEGWLDQPLRWSKPRMIFVCAHGDLFHESVPDEWIDQVFAVMALAPHHTFQALTKRAERMRRYFTEPRHLEARDGSHTAVVPPDRPSAWMHEAFRFGMSGEKKAEWGAFRWDGAKWHRPPAALPNVWLGVSAEDQKRADERIPHLLATPAVVRWVSAEPLLGPVDLTNYLRRTVTADGYSSTVSDAIDWVIAGGESGPGARPMHPAWARSLRDQCAAAGVAFHFKQWGEWEPGDADTAYGQQYYKVGKARAGRLLDGIEHNGMPA